MTDAFSKRIDLGRSVRARALCMMEAHGHEAERAARAAAREAGVSAAERNFWELVADRVARIQRGDDISAPARVSDDPAASARH
jgi:hypothetical protein